MFISLYITDFIGKIIFFSNIYFLGYSNFFIFFFGSERGHQLRMHPTGEKNGEDSSKIHTVEYIEVLITPHVHLQTYNLHLNISFHVLAAFLSYGVLFYL